MLFLLYTTELLREPRSSFASLCWRYIDWRIMCPEQNAVATDPSLSIYRSCCWVDAFEQPPVERSEELSSLVNNQSSSKSVVAVIASCWCPSVCAHRRHLEPQQIYRRWRIEVTSTWFHHVSPYATYAVSDDHWREPFFCRWLRHCFLSLLTVSYNHRGPRSVYSGARG